MSQVTEVEKARLLEAAEDLRNREDEEGAALLFGQLALAEERAAVLTPFSHALPEAMPEALKKGIGEFVEADMHAHAAGLMLRFAFSAGGVIDLLREVKTWWVGQTPEARERTERLALVEAGQLADAVADGPQGLDVLEGIALARDNLHNVTTTLWCCDAGNDARKVEGALHAPLKALWAAQAAQGAFESPLLAALARRGAGWWCTAPGERELLDEDAFDPASEGDLADFEEEEVA
jgi:hypothetical protein